MLVMADLDIIEVQGRSGGAFHGIEDAGSPYEFHEISHKVCYDLVILSPLLRSCYLIIIWTTFSFQCSLYIAARFLHHFHLSLRIAPSMHS